jgi:hypothetical protein
MKVFNDKARVKVLCSGRGFGKSRLLLTIALYLCISFQGTIDPVSPQVVCILMPTLKMAKAIHWLPLLSVLEGCPLVKDINKSDFRITFHGSRPDLILRGCDNGGDRLRGLNLHAALLDEFQDISPVVWEEVVFAALARNKDWQALLIGTPKGKTSYFFKIHTQALKEPDWSYHHFVTSDNPFFPRQHLERARRELPPKIFRQEFEASWESFEGALFTAIERHHITNDIPDSFRSIYLGADFGDIHPALAVVGLSHSGAYYIIDFWKNKAGIPVTEPELQAQAARFSKEYGIYRCFLPDDRPGSILSFRRFGKANGVPALQRSVEVKRNKPGPMERVQIGDSMFYQNRLFFGPKAADLYDEFASFHRDKDADGNLMNRPAKGQENHVIDATMHVVATLEFKHGDHVLNLPKTA